MTSLEFGKTLFLATLLVVSSWSADAAEIVLRSNGICKGNIVRLGDLADVHHEDPAVAEAWRNLPLFPRPSGVRVVRRQELAQLLAFSDEEIVRCPINGTEWVQIVGRVPDGKLTLQWSSKEAPIHKPAIHRSAYSSTLASYTQPNNPFPAAPSPKPTTAANETLAVVALYRIERGTRIEAEDVEIRAVPAGPQNDRLITDIAEVIGKETVQSIQAGDPVSADRIQSPRMVRRGENVTVRSVAAGIVITTSGKALEDGGEGDVVKIELDDSRERIAARVTGLQQAEIYASSARVVRPQPQQQPQLQTPSQQ
jgi:flagella basal body P-ring formation protein FlgA